MFQAFRRVKFQGLPSISSRSSSSYSHHSSSSSSHNSSSTVGPEYSRAQLDSMITRLNPTWLAVVKRFERVGFMLQIIINQPFFKRRDCTITIMEFA